MYPQQTETWNTISDVMVSVHVSSVLDCRFKLSVLDCRFKQSVLDFRFNLWSGWTKDYKYGIDCFSTKHVAIRSKSIADCL
jgi:hypothetical protein